jgi:dUTP pyrophosphatase
MKIKIIKFDNYKCPLRAHYNDAGADVHALDKFILLPHQTVKIPLGFGLELPDGLMACVFPRSGLTSKGIISHVPPVDSGYNGEIHAIITNTTDEIYTIEENDRIGQIVITPIILCEFTEELGNERGSKGFGSSGR